MKITIKLLLLLVLIFVGSLEAAITITGKVTGEDSKDPLPGANVMLTSIWFDDIEVEIESPIGAVSDVFGEYRILGVDEGTYTLRVTYMGYKTLTQKIEVIEDTATKFDFKLESKTIAGEEVVITTQREGQVAAINQQLTSDALVNVVSSEKILEVPDANVAESVARLPGVSIQRDGGEGSNIVVRGLSPQYSKITIDGIDVANTSASSRSTNLSAISQENLKGIEVFKSPTADMDGEAIGGTVNLKTSKAADDPEYILRAYGSYNQLESDLKQYDAFFKVSRRFYSNLIGMQLSLNSESRNRSADIFSGSYLLSPTLEDSTEQIWYQSSTVNDRIETRKRSGLNLILDYDYGNGYFMFSNFISQSKREIFQRQRTVREDNQGQLRIRETDRELFSMVNTIRGEHQVFGMDMDWSIAHSYSRSEMPFDHWIRFSERIKLPVEYNRDTTALALYNLASIETTATFDRAQHMQDDVKERNFIGNINFSQPIKLGKKISGIIKFGAKLKTLNRTRHYEEAQLWGYLDPPWNTMKSDEFLDDSYEPRDFLSGKADLGMILDAEKNRSFYNQYKDSTRYFHSIFYAYEGALRSDSRIPDYETDENVNGIYLMPKLNYKNLLTFIPGIRYEMVNNKYHGHNFFNLVGTSPTPVEEEYFINDTSADQSYNDLLPMIHLKVNPLDWMDFRFSVTKTLSRPNFNYLIPVQSLNTWTGSNIYLGNPRLKPARSMNYDAYVSVFQSTFGLISVGYFNKKIDDVSVLYRVYVDNNLMENGLPEFDIPLLQDEQRGYVGLYNGNSLLTPINLDESTVNGIEVELQTNFQMLPVPKFLKGVVITWNFSQMSSKTYFPQYRKIYSHYDVITRQSVYIDSSGLREGSIPGQAETLMNLTIGYDIKGFSARLSMFKQGESIDVIGSQEQLDSYTSPFTRWDLSLKQKVNSMIDLYLNVVNLTDTDDQTYQFKKDRDTSIEAYGMTIDLGAQIRF